MRRWTTTLAVAWIFAATLTTSALADGPRQAEAILADLRAAEMPQLDPADRTNAARIQQYIEQRNEVLARRVKLIDELYQARPDHPQVARFMPERWMALTASGRIDEAKREIEAILAEEEAPEALAREAAHQRAMFTANQGQASVEATLAAIDDFIRRAPEDDRGAVLLYQAAEQYLREAPAEQKKALYDRLLAEYPDSTPARRVRGAMRKIEGLGQPFVLSFNDAISGQEISMEKLQGKVVVIDFWATWCGPCIAEMPKMLSLYDEYKDQGVEFIGVSLDAPEDQGGLEKLKAFVQEHKIPWPQYYQGNAWESAFSRSWGINAIPAIFVVDRQGNLHSTTARGQLETMIPELLDQEDAGGE